MIVSSSHETGILDTSTVTVTYMNHILEVKAVTFVKKGIEIRKLDKNHFVDLRTGEIKDYALNDKKTNVDSINRTFRRLRELINANFDGSKNELFITLTYAENMTDKDRLYSDFDKFMKKVKYRYRKETSIDYISVVEPQGRGAWHCHVLMRFNDLKSVFMSYDTLFSMWQHGKILDIQRLNEVDNIGAYLSAYLTNAPSDDLKTGTKKYIKNSRLSMYPSGMNIYRHSRGIVKPVVKKMKYAEFKKIVGSVKPNYTKNTLILNDDEEFINQVQTEQYNLKRLTHK